VLPGYLHGTGDSGTKFEGSGVRWHRTGDLGRLDPQGRLWLLGRASARIQDARGILYPFAVECAAQQIPGVRRAAVLRLRNQRVLAIESADPKTQSSVLKVLAWAHLDEIRVLRSIPMGRRHNAKVDDGALFRKLSR
jgi:acyl-CoA synthetase (AMP-forming)/AMP-acid ligase II